MEEQVITELKTILDALDDLATSVQYYCIGVYGVKDSFVNDSLARARKASNQARKKLLEADKYGH